MDKVESDTTDYVYDFAKLEKTKELINYFSDCKISSITYCIAEQGQEEDIKQLSMQMS